MAEHRFAGPTTQGEIEIDESSATIVNTDDILNYMADMLAEMKGLASTSGCDTLAGLLELARHEAALRRHAR